MDTIPTWVPVVVVVAAIAIAIIAGVFGKKSRASVTRDMDAAVKKAKSRGSGDIGDDKP